MKAIKKYAYMSPETEILSLEAQRIIMGSDDIEIPEPSQNPSLGAPWRY